MMDLPQGATERLSLADPKRLGKPKLVLRCGGPDPDYHQAISGGGPGSALRGSPQAPARVRNRLPSRAARRSPADRYGRLPWVAADRWAAATGRVQAGGHRRLAG